MLDHKTILVTGGTGSFGTEFIKLTLENFKVKKLIIFSRDEIKKWEMQKLYADDSGFVFLLVMFEIEKGCTELFLGSITWFMQQQRRLCRRRTIRLSA